MQYCERYTTHHLELTFYMVYSEAEKASNVLLHMRNNADSHWFAISEHHYFQGSQLMVRSRNPHSDAFCTSAANLPGFDDQIAKQSLPPGDIGYCVFLGY